jgi:hypothetical protein
LPIKLDDEKKSQRLTKAERSKIILSSELKEVLIGLLLGDLHAAKQKKSINVRLDFEQGFVHKDYLYHLFDLFKSYCLAAPKIANRLPDKRTGKIYTRITFRTIALPCFNELYDIFYLEGKKIIPKNIGELLTPLGLAYWLCDDGTFCKSTHRVHLCTESFTLAEVNLLVKTINDKWNLNCHKVTRGSGYRVVISRKSLPILQSLLKDIMPSMMLHKIGL